MRSDIFREKSPLSNEDCFVVFDRQKSSFTFPVHIHPEYELNYVEGATGAHRIVGDSLETIGDQDLVLITNPELKHAWMDGDCQSNNIHEITLQFHPSFIEQSLDKKQFQTIRRLFAKASRGLVFGKETTERIVPLLRVITMERDGFYSVMKLFIILYELSKSDDFRELSKASTSIINNNDMLMNRLQDYVSKHIRSELSLPQVAQELNMSKSTFSRFLKSTTKMNFTEYLLDYKLNMAIRLLKQDMAIPDVGEQCGFNSLSYFYRVFKKMKSTTPLEFKKTFKKQQMIV